jgi:hypothetical protein
VPIAQGESVATAKQYEVMLSIASCCGDIGDGKYAPVSKIRVARTSCPRSREALLDVEEAANHEVNVKPRNHSQLADVQSSY